MPEPGFGIVGAGSTGLAIASDLLLRGARVRWIMEQDPGLVARLLAAESITLSGRLGQAKFPLPPLQRGDRALPECDVVIITATADRHREVARCLGPALRPGQLCVLATGYAHGAAVFARYLREAGSVLGPESVLAFNTTPHLAYAPGDGSVHLAAVKTWFEGSSVTADAARAACARLSGFFPALVPAEGQLASSLNNPNPVAHVPAFALNAVHAWQERGGAVPQRGAFHLGDFGSPGLDALRAELDAERLAVLDALGLGAQALGRNDFAARAYGPGSREDSSPRLGPTFQDRFVSEDVPCGLVPVEVLGARAAVPTPALSSLITLVSSLTGRDLRAEAQELGRLDVLPR